MDAIGHWLMSLTLRPAALERRAVMDGGGGAGARVIEVI